MKIISNLTQRPGYHTGLGGKNLLPKVRNLRWFKIFKKRVYSKFSLIGTT